MVFAPFVSPSLIVKRDILAYAATEAVRYGVTVKEIVDSFFDGTPRPGLAQQLERAYRASGLPPSETMQMVSSFFTVDEIETIDLLIVLEAHRDRLPTAAQAKELVEAATRLSRRVRAHDRYVKAAQAAHDANVVQTEDGPPPPPPPTRHPVKARSVQRYSGLVTT